MGNKSIRGVQTRQWDLCQKLAQAKFLQNKIRPTVSIKEDASTIGTDRETMQQSANLKAIEEKKSAKNVRRAPKKMYLGPMLHRDLF